MFRRKFLGSTETKELVRRQLAKGKLTNCRASLGGRPRIGEGGAHIGTPTELGNYPCPVLADNPFQ